MAIDRVAQPFYDNSVSEYHNKNYRQVLFTSGRAVQCRELTGIGNYATEHIKEIASLMYKDGTIITGCNVRSIDRTERNEHEDAVSGITGFGLITMNGGKIFVDGYPFEIEFSKFPQYSKSTIPIKLKGAETVYVEILDTVVTATEDETLLDPASGYDNYEAPGAHRLQRVARYISTAHKDYQTVGNIRIPVVELFDGKITYEAAAAGGTGSNASEDGVTSETNILDLMSQRTFETSGNYLVNGFKIKSASCEDNKKVGITVTPGVAYMNGNRVELQSAFTGYIDKVMVTSTVQGEEHAVVEQKDGDTILKDASGRTLYVHKYKLNSSPVTKITEVAIPQIGNGDFIVSGLGQDSIPRPANGAINHVIAVFSGGNIPSSGVMTEPPADATTVYKQGSGDNGDYTVSGTTIVWNAGKAPANNTKVYVIYIYKPTLDSSSSKGLYRIEYGSEKKELTLNLKISNGMIKIPKEYANPSVKSIKVINGKVNAQADAMLRENVNYYVSGNTVYIATKEDNSIPLSMTRSSTGSADDYVGQDVGERILDAEIKTVKQYSEKGLVYYKPDAIHEAHPDFVYTKSTGQIHWVSKNRPDYGSNYIIEALIPPKHYVVFDNPEKATVEITFTYESQNDIYSGNCHDSYLVIDDSVALGKRPGVDGADNITIKYEYAKPRTTTVGLDTNGKIAFYHGTIEDNDGNLTPVVPTTSLPVADIYVKPTTAENFIITSTNNYRMRMTDIRDMFDRLKDVEYNISLNDLEKDAETKMAGNVLRGVFTDPFTSVRKADNSLLWSFIRDGENQAIPNITQGLLSPNFRRATVELEVDTTGTEKVGDYTKPVTTAGLFGDVYMMTKNYGQEVWLRQPYATKIRSAAEGLDLMECFPSFSIDPDNDQFIEYEDQDILYDEETSDTKNCYEFNGQAGHMSSGVIPNLHTAANSNFVTVQFWQYIDTDKGCIPFSFGTIDTTSNAYAQKYGFLQKAHMDLWSTTSSYGINTGNGDVLGIPNEELKGYWRAITAIFQDGTNDMTPNNLEIYINGEKQADPSTKHLKQYGTFRKSTALVGNAVCIGDYSCSMPTYQFQGKIADIRIWNKKISLQQIKDFSGKELTGTEEGLVSWWKSPIEGGKVKNSVKTGPDLVVSNTNNVKSVTRSFAKMLGGNDSNVARGAVMKNVMDLTVGNVPDNQTNYVVDPATASKAVKNAYVTNNAALAEMGTEALGGKAAGAYTSAKASNDVASQIYYTNYGGSKNQTTSSQYDAYSVEETYYEKVVTTTNEILGNFVTDVQSISKLRQRWIHVQGQGFLGETDGLSVTFDGQPVVLFKEGKQIPELPDMTDGSLWQEDDGMPSTAKEVGGRVVGDRYWRTSSKGTFKFMFKIPKDTQIGVREVRLTAPGGIELKASYWGAGMKASKLTLTQQNEVVTWEPRTQVIGQMYMNSDGWMLLDGWNCRSRCGTTPLCQTFYVNDSSLTKPVIKDIKTNSDVFLTKAGIFFQNQGECVDCIAGFVELTDSGVPRSDSGAGPSRFVGGVKVFDSKTINMSGGDPAKGTAEHQIEWENLVPLEGSKGYGFIVGSTDGNTTMWVASIENNEVNTDVATHEKVIQEPDRGILLSSPNGQTWATYIYEDMKYTFYIANFFNDPNLATAPTSMCPSQAFGPSGKVAYITYKPIDLTMESVAEDDPDREYKQTLISTFNRAKVSKVNTFMFEVNAKNSHDGSGFVQYEYSIPAKNGEWAQWKPFTNGSAVTLDKAVDKLKFRVALYSYNPYSTPVVSKYAYLTLRQYVLPAIYTSITGKVGTWNTAEIYIDKFYDPTLSAVNLYISPDCGYTWKRMENAVDLTPITASSTTYGGNEIDQWHYQLKLTVDKPEIIEAEAVQYTGTASVRNNAGNCKFKVALVDAQGNESESSDAVTINLTSENNMPHLVVKFDPNATGYRVYMAQPNSELYTLYYDSTATAKVHAGPDREAIKVGDTDIYLDAGALRFPSAGKLLIDGEYITYTSIDKDTSNAFSGEDVYKLTSVTRGASNNGVQSEATSHDIGAEVMLMDDGYSQQDSPTPCVSGVWRFPEYTRDSKFNWSFVFEKPDMIPNRGTTLDTATPCYDEDLPANYKSETVTFRIDMTYLTKDTDGTTLEGTTTKTIDTLREIPYAGRVMITLGNEEF